MSVEEEVALLQEKIKELGTEQADGRIGVEFGVLFDATQDIFEALNGTLRAAKREKKVSFEGILSYLPLLCTIPFLQPHLACVNSEPNLTNLSVSKVKCFLRELATK